ncbi:MAG: TlpA family protein disulfide reductase [Pyrinomonadaceae bacterium]
MSNPIVFFARTALCAVLVFFAAGTAVSQAAGQAGPVSQMSPIKVTQIDIEGLRTLIKPKGKPLLINFWATWCDPCREEFPDLVKIDNAYRGKIDFLTISLDDVEEIDRLVPKFLGEQKARMPAYLLRTTDESAAIALVAKDWSGNLPLTVLYHPNGDLAYSHGGKIKLDTMSAELDKLLAARATNAKTDLYVTMDFVKIKDGRRAEAMFYYEKNWKVLREAALKKGIIHSYELVEAKSETSNAFDLVMVTRYRGEEQFRDREKNFEPLLRARGPDGPVLKNDIKPADFRQSVFVYDGVAAFSSAM